ncbi:MAG TPA: SMUG2 DNA glycosylase family protein [Arenibacter sp.]|nr:SMUG2 DNA glycosylase family protein [Arenibacter sp.]
METFADKVIKFNRELDFSGELYKGIQVMNPFRDNQEILSIIDVFYNKFYGDTRKRKLILGINPGRLGAGVTGIPFTDTKRLSDICNIKIDSVVSHEPSSVFIYEVIEKYGGLEKFYQDYYINSLSPLGFIEKNAKGNWVNCNYYDYEELFEQTEAFIISNLKKQIGFGIDTEHCTVLGKKNAKYLRRINEKEKLFGSITVVDHPRYIVQYKSKEKDKYLTDYLGKLK